MRLQHVYNVNRRDRLETPPDTIGLSLECDGPALQGLHEDLHSPLDILILTILLWTFTFLNFLFEGELRETLLARAS